MRRRQATAPGMVVGLIAITVGTLFLLNNLGVAHVRFWSVWPVIFIVIGGVNLLSPAGRLTQLWGAALVGLGGYWLGDNIGLAPVPMRQIWPVFLIAAGAIFMARSLKGPGGGGGDGGSASSSTLRELAVFGGVKRAVSSHHFEGGELVAFCAGHEIDLRNARLARQEAVIDASAILGGVELRVPEDWNVVLEGVAVFGGYEDKTRSKVVDGTEPRLVVRGFAIFGGVEIKN